MRNPLTFVHSALPLRETSATRRSSPPRRRVSRTPPTASLSRRTLLRTLPLLPLLPSLTHAAQKPPSLESHVIPIIMCQTIMRPVSRYITEGAWDKGRTNVNYCTRVLALRKNMREAAELLDGDAYYENMEIMGDMTITMTQLDASLYTPLFIPADEGISLEQKVYQSQARAFYDQAVGMIDSFLKRVPEDVVSRARGRASQERYEIRMELE